MAERDAAWRRGREFIETAIAERLVGRSFAISFQKNPRRDDMGVGQGRGWSWAKAKVLFGMPVLAQKDAEDWRGLETGQFALWVSQLTKWQEVG